MLARVRYWRGNKNVIVTSSDTNLSFTQHTFKAEYSPTICENYTTKISFTNPQPEVVDVVMWYDFFSCSFFKIH